MFSDDFNFFDLSKWKHDITLSGGGNWEFQLYHNNRSNSFVRNGVLTIKPTLTEERIGAANLRNGFTMDVWGGSLADECTGNNWYGCSRTSGAGGNILNPIQSAKPTTQESFSFKYGRVEVRAKLPEGDWLWPAIWLLPRRNQYGGWPASGEIDIMESRGNPNYPFSAGGGVESFGSTLHWGPDWSQNRFELTHVDFKHSAKLSEEFHTYGLHWTADRLYTYFDNPSNIILDVDLSSQSFWDKGKFASSYKNPWAGLVNAPFNEEFYIVINLAVGGTAGYFPDGVAGKPWSDKSSTSVNQFYDAKGQWWPTWKNPKLQIDSVKVWHI